MRSSDGYHLKVAWVVHSAFAMPVNRQHDGTMNLRQGRSPGGVTTHLEARLWLCDYKHPVGAWRPNRRCCSVNHRVLAAVPKHRHHDPSDHVVEVVEEGAVGRGEEIGLDLRLRSARFSEQLD